MKNVKDKAVIGIRVTHEKIGDTAEWYYVSLNEVEDALCMVYSGEELQHH
jgi:hypothetical protein